MNTTRWSFLLTACLSASAAFAQYPLSIPNPKGVAAPVYQQLEVIAKDGTKLIVHRWTPPTAPANKPVVIFLPGIGMHGEPYRSVAAGFTSKQISFVAPDYRGHGRSEGKRGKLADAAVLRSDLGEVIGLVNKRHADAPVFLAGESMGGLFAADYAVHGERRLAGLILLAPAFKVHDSQIQLSGLGEFFKGKIPLNTDKKLKPSTRVPGWMDARIKDKLALGEVDSGYITALGVRQLDWPSSASHIKLPLYMSVAGKEEIVNPKTMKLVFDKAGTPAGQKVWKEWDEARHTMCWDPLTPQIFADVTNWVLAK